MRLVSLWWELPPRLDSNINIWNSGLQQKSVGLPVSYSAVSTALPVVKFWPLTQKPENTTLFLNTVQNQNVVSSNMGVQERKAREKEELRNDILDAALLR